MYIGKCHPDGQDGILLSEGLSACNTVVVPLPDDFPQKELPCTGYQREESNEYLFFDVFASLFDDE